MEPCLTYKRSLQKSMRLRKIKYSLLNPKQKEAYNFQKVSAILADYGYLTIRLSDDWEGADFIAQHVGGADFLKIQLKGRLYFAKIYLGKDIWICFPYKSNWYLYPHDATIKEFEKYKRITHTPSWKDKGIYHFPSLSTDVLKILEKYKV